MYTTIVRYREASSNKRLYRVLISLVLYYVIVSLLFEKFGSVSMAFTILPVLCTSWLFGIRAGLTVWILVTIGNCILQGYWDISFMNAFIADLPGIFAVFPFAIIAGYISNLSLEYRNRVEELAQKNNELEQQIAIREELEMLFSEVNHRIKNNLAMITGILEMESMRNTNPDTLEIIDNVKTRIYSVAAVHEQLYKQEISGTIPIKIFTEKLLKHIELGSEAKENIKIRSEIESLSIDAKLAIHLALIINELVINAIKYAFPNQNHGHIQVLLTSNNSKLKLTVKDDGIGLPEGFNPTKTDPSKSIGLYMITNLTRQWDGTFNYKNGNGAHFDIILNMK